MLCKYWGEGDKNVESPHSLLFGCGVEACPSHRQMVHSVWECGKGGLASQQK